MEKIKTFKEFIAENEQLPEPYSSGGYAQPSKLKSRTLSALKPFGFRFEKTKNYAPRGRAEEIMHLFLRDSDGFQVVADVFKGGAGSFKEVHAHQFHIYDPTTDKKQTFDTLEKVIEFLKNYSKAKGLPGADIDIDPGIPVKIPTTKILLMAGWERDLEQESIYPKSDRKDWMNSKFPEYKITTFSEFGAGHISYPAKKASWKGHRLHRVINNNKLEQRLKELPF